VLWFCSGWFSCSLFFPLFFRRCATSPTPDSALTRARTPNPEGWYYLFYAGDWDKTNLSTPDHKALGVARARAVGGPWEKLPAPVLRARGGAGRGGAWEGEAGPHSRFVSPGHCSVVRAPATSTGQGRVGFQSGALGALTSARGTPVGNASASAVHTGRGGRGGGGAAAAGGGAGADSWALVYHASWLAQGSGSAGPREMMVDSFEWAADGWPRVGVDGAPSQTPRALPFRASNAIQEKWKWAP
jgi:hypothetical protein